MLTDKRLLHMLGVARRCYQIAKDYGFPEDTCRDFFLMGLLHDVGYEFTNVHSQHAEIGCRMLEHIAYGDSYSLTNIAKSIEKHGDCFYTKETAPIRLLILNQANMTTSENGKPCSIEERLMEIKKRFGEDSIQYANAMLLVETQQLNCSIQEIKR